MTLGLHERMSWSCTGEMDDRPCPPDNTDNRQRTRYFEGKLLTAEDFEREQQYHRAALRRHNVALHGWGVARGLGVTLASSGAAEVCVAPGYALDPCGQEILLTNAITIRITDSGASSIAARAIETVVSDGIVRDDVEVAMVRDPQAPWVVLASISAPGGDLRVDTSVRRVLSLD